MNLEILIWCCKLSVVKFVMHFKKILIFNFVSHSKSYISDDKMSIKECNTYSVAPSIINEKQVPF